jgi:hypothetical protein
MSEDYFFVAEYEISCGALQGHIEIGEVLWFSSFMNIRAQHVAMLVP